MFIGRKKEYTRPAINIDLNYIRFENEILEDFGDGVVAFSKYPYDNTLEHFIYWFEWYPDGKILTKYNKMWFKIVCNEPKNKSIPELGHYHFLKY